MADRAQLAATPGVKNVGVGGSVGLVAPLATPFTQGLVGRGGTLRFPGRGMTRHTILAWITPCTQCERSGSAREKQSQEDDKSAHASEAECQGPPSH